MLVDWKDSILNVVKEHLRDSVFGPVPAKVKSVSQYGAWQCVDVEIQVSRKRISGRVTLEKGQTIYGVPFINPSAGGGALTFPVKVGDNVLLVFGMRNISNWQLSDGTQEVEPSDPRYMHKDDAIAIPGLCTTSNHLNPSTDNVELKFKNCLISEHPDGTIVITNTKGTLELKPDGTNVLSNQEVTYKQNPDGSTLETNGSGTKTLNTDGSFNLNGFIISASGAASSPISVTAPTVSGTTSVLAASKELAGHTHNQANDSGGDTEQPTLPNN